MTKHEEPIAVRAHAAQSLPSSFFRHWTFGIRHCRLRVLRASVVNHGRLQHHPNNPVLHQGCVEIHEKADLLAAQTQVGEQLSLVQRTDLFNALELQDHFSFNDDVQLVPAIELDTLVRNRQGNLPLKSQATQTELMAKAFLVC